jgi:replication factor C subunit 2/4
MGRPVVERYKLRLDLIPFRLCYYIFSFFSRSQPIKQTSVALALCRQLWHPSQWRRRVLELNASDERGISVVRNKIKHFASLTVAKGNSNVSSTKSFFLKKKDAGSDEMETDDMENYPNPPFKIIILDEADTVTPDAQAALRRIIEAHSKITRFILICNYVTRVIEPLASRCAKFRFQSLPPSSMKARLEWIANEQNCSESEKDLLDDILEYADGDMRQAVTTLQSVHSLAAGGAKVDKAALAEIAGLPPPAIVDMLWTALLSNSFDTMEKVVETLSAEGFSAQLLLSALVPKLVTDQDLNELSKAELAIRIAEAEKNMIEGGDEQLQLLTVCSLAVSCFEQSNTINK